MATSGNKSFKSTKIDSGRTPSTAVDGYLAGRRPLCGSSKKEKETCHRLARQNGLSEKLGKPLESILFVSFGVHQMILATFKSVNNARGMFEQQSKPSDFGWTKLHPDRGAQHLSLDLPGPARILVLECL